MYDKVAQLLVHELGLGCDPGADTPGTSAHGGAGARMEARLGQQMLLHSIEAQ